MTQPEKKFSAGAISATVWKNKSSKEHGNSEFHTVSFERTYLDKESGQWKTTHIMRVGDLPKAALVFNKAYEYLSLKADTPEEAVM